MAHFPEHTTDSVGVRGVGLPMQSMHHPKSHPKSSARKRYPKRGKASGWIETRTANPKRKKPNQYQVYRWEAEGKRHSRSLRRAIAPIIETMISDGEPWRVIVERIEESRKSQC